jgi:hypothetical protein
MCLNLGRVCLDEGECRTPHSSLAIIEPAHKNLLLPLTDMTVWDGMVAAAQFCCTLYSCC